jgi:hypothetical protein
MEWRVRRTFGELWHKKHLLEKVWLTRACLEGDSRENEACCDVLSVQQAKSSLKF